MPNGVFDGDTRKSSASARDEGPRSKPSRAAGNKNVRQAGPHAPIKPARSVLRGELDHIGLGTLLTIIEMEKRSGLLILQRKRELGRLSLREGRVVRARIEGARPSTTTAGRGAASTGVDAVYELLSWAEGQFELWQAVVEDRDEIQESTTFLLMEGARRSDEADADADAISALMSRW